MTPASENIDPRPTPNKVTRPGVTEPSERQGMPGRGRPRREEARVAALAADELVVGAELGEHAVVDDRDAIGAGRGREPVGDDDDGASAR